MHNTPILHQYAMSPFAEKARLMLGYKRIAWAAVEIPVVMPKPDLTALTGGYRRTPVLQIGADIYCDTALIARVLERLEPQPTLYPASAPLAGPLAAWIDSTLFWTMIPYAMQPAGAAAILAGSALADPKVFVADRASFSASVKRLSLNDAKALLPQHLAAFEAQLERAGGPHLFGAELSIADFSLAHCLWFIRLAKPVAGILDRHPCVCVWLDRMLAIGHGESSRMDSGAAVETAAAASGHAPVAVAPGLGFEAGAGVVVMAADYGHDPVTGTLVGLSADSVTLERRDERAGTVHVHFPRAGFQLRQEKKE